jgi:hypothetical protein
MCPHSDAKSSTCTSILWQVPLWQKIADRGRVCCGITSLQSHPRVPIMHTLRRPCRVLFNRLQRALAIPASRFLRCSPPARWFLGLVTQQVLPYVTTRVTHAEWRHRSPSPPCGKRRLVRFFWLHLPMRVLPESTTITLHLHIPLIIIGVEDVAFNRFSVLLVWVFMPLHELRALDFCLHASHNLIVHHHPSSHTLAYNLLSAFLDSFNSSNTHVIFSSAIPEKHRLFSIIALCITPLGLISRFTIVHVQT